MSAFYGCISLTSVTIPNSVTDIKYNAFTSCTALTSISILATTPPTLSSSVFDNTNNCPIYVPAASLNAYKTATNWSAYADRIQAIGEVVGQPDDSQHGAGIPDNPEIEIN